MNKHRCPWAKDSLEIEYHDAEWGRETHDDQLLIRVLSIRGYASWFKLVINIKKNAKNFKRAFDNFDYNICADYTDEYLESLREDEGIIRK